jgi:hypothetical protein
MLLGGEKAKQEDGFANLAKVLIISMLGIYAALLLQFNNAVKPLLVFAATPYGVVGALLALAIMGSPFGFMAFLGRQPDRRNRQPRNRAFDSSSNARSRQPFEQAICDAESNACALS